jgi:hypothetical protein
MRTKPERIDAPLQWLRANKHDLGALTGADTRALLAIAACWRLYWCADYPAAVLAAIGHLLRCMQPKCWKFAKALIPWAGEWSHEPLLWNKLVEEVPSIARDFIGGQS